MPEKGDDQNVAAIIEKVTNEFIKNDIPDFRPGDTVKVSVKIKEGNRQRIQVFEGLCIKRQEAASASLSQSGRCPMASVSKELSRFIRLPSTRSRLLAEARSDALILDIFAVCRPKLHASKKNANRNLRRSSDRLFPKKNSRKTQKINQRMKILSFYGENIEKRFHKC